MRGVPRAVVAGAVMSAKRRCSAGLTPLTCLHPRKKLALRRGRDLRADGQATSKRQPYDEVITGASACQLGQATTRQGR